MIVDDLDCPHDHVDIYYTTYASTLYEPGGDDIHDCYCTDCGKHMDWDDVPVTAVLNWVSDETKR